MKIVLAIMISLMSFCAVDAQDFWVRPEKYFYEQNETAKIELVSGEDFIATPFAASRSDVLALDMLFRGTVADIRRNFVEGDKAAFTAKLSTDGVYTLILDTKPRELFMKKAALAEFVKQFGLEEKVNPDTLSSDSVRVFFHHVNKAYVRVGKQVDRRIEKSQNLTIEVIPDRNPQILKRGERIMFTILKNGAPAFGVRVKIWNRWNNRTTVQHIYTLKDGTVNTTISSPGDWMVSVVDLSSSGGDYSAECFNLLFGYR